MTPLLTPSVAIVGGRLLRVLVAHQLTLPVLPVRRRLAGQVPMLAG